MFREFKNYLPSASICIVLFTLVYASQSRVAFVPNPSRDPTSTLNRSFETSFHETALKRPDSPYLQLPIFQHSRVPLLDKEQFSPAHGSGREELPEGTKNVLIPPVGAAQQASHRSSRSRGINVACYLKKMIVRVNKQILGPEVLEGKLKLGTCDISKTTRKYHQFIYDMDQCGSKRKLIKNRVTYSNVLHFPEISPGPIRRAMPFSNEIECHFNRYHYSYKIGFMPQVEYQSYFRPLKTTDSVVLTPRDAMWKRLSPTEAYTIGDSMYFQADGPPLAEDERLFVDSCYVTSDSSHLSMPRYTVIENHGCMTDSKSSRWSRFIQSEERSIVQFSLEAFLFRGMIGKHLYMHCDIYVGGINPTPSSKSCTYNQATKRWEELYGVNSVCSCCDTNCLGSDLSGLAVMEKEDEFVEPRRIFEEVFGLD
ncbi:zona pellucida sperm-binding protein 3d.2 isoform X2 [Triplophysa rosa]|uniref:zona pellucida sperm-binding protein 3d.2 isoform X2 n=1 Tax=Triplophysa rosa TaxID=992332 RepID=UPI002546086A|nr:zona pellucida sperm-binding protein 3d.2 isoform X2 [Triplophysa rosa]